MGIQWMGNGNSVLMGTSGFLQVAMCVATDVRVGAPPGHIRQGR